MSQPGDHRRAAVAFQPDRAILAGFVGTLIASAWLFFCIATLAPRMQTLSIFGSMYTGDALHTDPTAIQMLGLFAQFVLCAAIIALLYPRIFPLLPGHGVMRGVYLGVGLWIISMVIALPIWGAGFFGLDDGPLTPILSLITHLIYGALLAGVYGHPVPGEEY